MLRWTVMVLLVTVGGSPVLIAQQERDAMEPRPPLILTASRRERLEAFVRLYLQEFLGAIQRADTVALGVLVPDRAIPDAEKPVAGRAGCATLGAANARLRAARAGESTHPELPLSGVRLRNVTIDVGLAGDTVARVAARILERRGGRIGYAPVRLAFIETEASWRIVLVNGALVGLCGMALVR